MKTKLSIVKAGLLAFAFLVSLLTFPLPASADITPVGCRGSALHLDLLKEPNANFIGAEEHYVVYAFGSSPGCDSTNNNVIFTKPGLNGLPDPSTTMTLASDVNFPADGSGNTCYSDGDSQGAALCSAEEAIHGGHNRQTIPNMDWKVNVNPGVTQATAEADVTCPSTHCLHDVDGVLDNSGAVATVSIIIPTLTTTLTKTASPTTLVLTPGSSGTVTYTITETNTGTVPITETMSDPDLNNPPNTDTTCTPSNLPATFTLAPSASTTYTCTKTYTDAEQGVHTDTVTSIAHPVVDNQTITNVTVNESANATVNVTTVRTNLTKMASPTSGPAPLAVTYTVTETNTGDIPLTPPVITDSTGSTFTFVSSSDSVATQLNPGATWTWTQNETIANCSQTITDTVTATTHPIVNGVILDNITSTETASATVTTQPCVGKPGKFKAWGRTPDKDFEVWVFSEFMPAGKVSVKDHTHNPPLDIEATSITSVTTTQHTGTATGIATVNGQGSHQFTVNVWDGTVDPIKAPRGTFEIIVPDLMYDNKEPLSFGVVGILK